MTPRISVVIPVYNRGPQVAATIDSALAQTLAPDAYEVIVVDDGSTNGTAEFLKRTYESHPRVRLIAQTNAGVAAARNRGLEAARGEFIAYLDHDDRWLPDKLERQLAAFAGRPTVGVVYCLWREVDEQGVPLPEAQQMTHAAWWRPLTGRVYQELVPRNFIISMSVPLLRTQAVRRAGGFDPATVPCDDYDLWLRLARCWEFACVPRELLLYTHHGEQQSNDVVRMWRAAPKIFRKHWPRFLGRPKKLWFMTSAGYFASTAVLYLDAKAALCRGDLAGVRTAFQRVLRRYPLAFLTPQWLYLARRLAAKDVTPF